MRKELVNEKLNSLERVTGIKPDGVVVFHKIESDGIGGIKTYTFEERDGKRIYYKNGLRLSPEQMKELRTNCVIILDNI